MLGMIARPRNYTAVVASSNVFQGAFPITNISNNDYGRVGRLVAATSGTYQLQLDLGASPPPIDVASILWHNLVVGNTIQVRGSNNSNVLGNVQYDSGVLAAITGASTRDVPAPSKFLLTMSAIQTYRYWHFTFNLAIAPAVGYIQMSRVLLMKKAVFAIGAQRAELGAVDMNQRIELESGDERSTEDTLLIRPTAALDMRYAKETEMQDVLGQYTLGMGTSKPMMVVVDLTNPYLQDQIVFGRPDKIMNLQSDIYDIWSFQASVKSIGP